MLCQIVCTTDFAQNLLSLHIKGTVHSVYHKTINISLQNRLISIQISGSPLSPISLISSLSADEMSALHIETGDSVNLTDGEIIIDNKCAFSVKNAEVVNTSLSFVPNIDIYSIKDNITSVLSASTAHGLRGLWYRLSDDSSLGEELVLMSAKSKLADCTEHLKSGDFRSAAECLTRLIGLGIGLTPSGDDFLCGALAMCHAYLGCDNAFSKELIRQTAECLANTNDISAAFLRCAADGLFSQAVISLFSAASKQQISDAFSAIGHSSGMDTLCGILYMAQNTDFL